MVRKVIILRRANNQFQSICDYLANEFGKGTADAFIFEVENCVATLQKFPLTGHPEPLPGKYEYRSRIVGEYNKMYYFLRGNTMVIAAFADMRMHPDKVRNTVIGDR